MFVARRNVVTGEVEWVARDSVEGDGAQEQGESDAEDSDEETNDGVAASMHLDMLNDHERNDAYANGLRAAFHELGDGARSHVLDIGTGSGLLAMLAARLGGTRVERVTACEVFPVVARAAQRIVAHNGLDDIITVIPRRSDALSVPSDLPRRADVLVTEIFDSELLGEGILPTLRHAWKELLSPGATVLPSSAVVHGMLVESTLLSSTFRMDDVSGPFGRPLFSTPPCRGPASPLSIQADALAAGSHLRPLSAPFEAFQFDFSNPPLDGTYVRRLSVPATAAGTVHAVVYWWTLTLAPGVTLTTAPAVGVGNRRSGGWRDHWMQVACCLPTPSAVNAGDAVDIAAVHDDFSIWFAAGGDEARATEPPGCTCGQHLTMMRARIAALHDPAAHWAPTLAALAPLDKGARVLHVDDGIAAATVAVQAGFSRVVSVEEGLLAAKLARSQIPSVAPGLEIVGAPLSELTLSQLGGAPADVLLSEPHFSAFQHDLPWRRFLRLWFLWHDLRARGLLAERAVCVPAGIVVTARLAHFDDLWRSHAPVSHAAGIDVAAFNKLGGVDDRATWSDLCFPFDLCNYVHTLLSEPVDVFAAADLSAEAPAARQAECVLKADGGEGRRPNAIVLSVDTWAVQGGERFAALPQGACASLTRQAVLFLPEGGESTDVRLKVDFKMDAGDLAATARWE